MTGRLNQTLLGQLVQADFRPKTAAGVDPAALAQMGADPAAAAGGPPMPLPAGMTPPGQPAGADPLAAGPAMIGQLDQANALKPPKVDQNQFMRFMIAGMLKLLEAQNIQLPATDLFPAAGLGPAPAPADPTAQAQPAPPAPAPAPKQAAFAWHQGTASPVPDPDRLPVRPFPLGGAR